MTLDQLISLIASFGACLAAVATFLTVREMRTQRISSYRPELTIPRINFSGAPPHEDYFFPCRWTLIDGSSLECHTEFTDRFFVPINNIGLGVAKNVKIHWYFPVEQTVADIKKIATFCHQPIDISFKNGLVEIKNSMVILWKNGQEKYFDYISPLSIEKNLINIELPYIYVHLISIYIFLGLKSPPDDNCLSNIPVLTAVINYQDIGNMKHQTVIKFNCEFYWANFKEMKFRAQLVTETVALNRSVKKSLAD